MKVFLSLLISVLISNFVSSNRGIAIASPFHTPFSKSKKVYSAVKSGDKKKLIKLIDQGKVGGLNKRFGDEKNTPLMLAVKASRADLVQVLVKTKGIDLDKSDIYGNTPLVFAAKNLHFEMAEVLVDHGANIQTANKEAYRADDFARLYSQGHRLALKIDKLRWSRKRASKKVKIENNGYRWKNCERKYWGYHTIPFDENGEFVPECAPDVLYSWKSESKYRDRKNQVTDENLLPMSSKSGLYTWRTPIGTFGYGDQQIRIKLRDNAQFILLENAMSKRKCDQFPYEEKQRSVYVSHLPDVNLTEYLLCSSGPIASWSMNLAQSIAEMRQEKKWIDGNQRNYAFPTFAAKGHYDIFMRPEGGVNLGAFSHRNSYLGNNVDTGTDWSEESLNQRMRHLGDMGDGAISPTIFYGRGVNPSIEDHFRSKFSGSYFQE